MAVACYGPIHEPEGDSWYCPRGVIPDLEHMTWDEVCDYCKDGQARREELLDDCRRDEGD